MLTLPFADPRIALIQNQFADLELAHTAANRTADPTFALFQRDVDYRETILLISPSVAYVAPILGSGWADVGGPGLSSWTLLVGSASAKEILGVQ